MTPLEKVARVLCRVAVERALRGDWTAPPAGHDEATHQRMVDRDWHKHKAPARAAMEALREPPENYQDFGTDKMWKDRTSADVWRAMIDAALSERVARPIEPEPQSFSGLLDFCASRFNIQNLNILPAPPWESDLFWERS